MKDESGKRKVKMIKVKIENNIIQHIVFKQA
jgi:hypothetical protein